MQARAGRRAFSRAALNVQLGGGGAAEQTCVSLLGRVGNIAICFPSQKLAAGQSRKLPLLPVFLNRLKQAPECVCVEMNCRTILHYNGNILIFIFISPLANIFLSSSVGADNCCLLALSNHSRLNTRNTLRWFGPIEAYTHTHSSTTCSPSRLNFRLVPHKQKVRERERERKWGISSLVYIFIIHINRVGHKLDRWRANSELSSNNNNNNTLHLLQTLSWFASLQVVLHVVIKPEQKRRRRRRRSEAKVFRIKRKLLECCCCAFACSCYRSCCDLLDPNCTTFTFTPTKRNSNPTRVKCFIWPPKSTNSRERRHKRLSCFFCT